MHTYTHSATVRSNSSSPCVWPVRRLDSPRRRDWWGVWGDARGSRPRQSLSARAQRVSAAAAFGVAAGPVVFAFAFAFESAFAFGIVVAFAFEFTFAFAFAFAFGFAFGARETPGRII